MRYEDLPAHLKAQVDAKVGAGGKKKRTTRREAGVDGPGWCKCGEAFPTYKAWERTHMGPGHRRFDILPISPPFQPVSGEAEAVDG